MGFLPILALGWLWFRLIDHLRVEWAVNPQYAYGWAVPFLCLYLLWRKAGRPPHGSSQATPQAPAAFSLSALQLFSFFLLSLLYLPTRLIQEANPEWRLVSWALAIEVIGLTLLFIRFALGSKWLAKSAFAICFFLVAIPWPTFIEAPIIQGLMRANVGATAELLSAFGVPAVQHGNVIEVATGTVGIDDACSGIRSFQATLMISLFLGELYALSLGRRVLCVFAGFTLSFLFNVGRTTLLTWVAARKGAAAITSWHDPAGVTILVGCFLCLWLIAWGLRGKAEMLKAEKLKRETAIGPARFSGSAFQRFSVFLTVWLVLVEAGTELWYRSHEWRVPKGATWHVEFPRENATFRELPLSGKTEQLLRYDEGYSGTWREGPEQRWQVVFLRWNPGRIAVHLAKSHTPEVCLTAAGRPLVSQSSLRAVGVHGLQLPFRSYVVKDENGPLHVFYCLWEDHAEAQSFRTTRMTYPNRLAPVLAGRRNSGQRSLEVAIWGIADQQEAGVALASELQKLIKVER